MEEKEEKRPRNTRSSKKLAIKKAVLRRTRRAKQDEGSSESDVCDTDRISLPTSLPSLAVKEKKETTKESNMEEEEEKRPRNTRASKKLATKQAVLRQTRSRAKKDGGSSDSEVCDTDKISISDHTSDSGRDLSYINKRLDFDIASSIPAVMEAKNVSGKRSRWASVRREQTDDLSLNSADKRRGFSEVHGTDGDIDTFDEDEQSTARPRAKRSAVYEKQSSNAICI